MIGVTFGFIGFGVLISWLELFFKNFNSESKWVMPLCLANVLIWVVGMCVIPLDYATDFMKFGCIYIFGSLVVFLALRILGIRK